MLPLLLTYMKRYVELNNSNTRL